MKKSKILSEAANDKHKSVDVRKELPHGLVYIPEAAYCDVIKAHVDARRGYKGKVWWRQHPTVIRVGYVCESEAGEHLRAVVVARLGAAGVASKLARIARDDTKRKKRKRLSRRKEKWRRNKEKE